MSKYGYLEVFHRVPWSSRLRESTVYNFCYLFVVQAISCSSWVIYYVIYIRSLRYFLLLFSHLTDKYILRMKFSYFWSGSQKWNSEHRFKYSRLSLSRSPKNTLKYFDISVPRHSRFAGLRKKSIDAFHFTNEYVIWLLKLDILKILWKRREIFFTIFCYLLLEFHIKSGTRLSLRDMRLVEVSEVAEITRVVWFYFDPFCINL